MITKKLATDAGTVSRKWKFEREKEEQIDLILASLTQDKRIQTSLRNFGDKLPMFLEYVRE